MDARTACRQFHLVDRVIREIRCAGNLVKRAHENGIEVNDCGILGIDDGSVRRVHDSRLNGPHVPLAIEAVTSSFTAYGITLRGRRRASNSATGTGFSPRASVCQS